MTSRNEPQTAAPPSLSKLAKTTVIALVAAATLLVTVVLPAEYAIDPVGTGRLLGLTDISSPALAAVESVSPASALLAPVQKGPLAEYPSEFKFDVFDITLAPYEYIEYKYRLEKGAAMLYTWKASAPLIHDLHGERAADASGGRPAEESFDKQDRRQASGSFTAPFSGIHGWYWENPGGETVTVRLTTSGFYSSAVAIHSDRTRHLRELRPLDTLSPLSSPSAGTTGRP